MHRAVRRFTWIPALIIDVAGSTDINESVTQNIIAVQLRGAELANDPLQRFGVFRGQAINIDIRRAGHI